MCLAVSAAITQQCFILLLLCREGVRIWQFDGFLSATLVSLFVYRLVTESGAVLGGRPDLLHHSTGTVLGRYGGICRGDLTKLIDYAQKSVLLLCHVGGFPGLSEYTTKLSTSFLLLRLVIKYLFWISVTAILTMEKCDYKLFHTDLIQGSVHDLTETVLFRIWAMLRQVKFWMKTSPLLQCPCRSWQLCWGFSVLWSAALESDLAL